MTLANQVNPRTAGFTRDTPVNHFCEPHEPGIGECRGNLGIGLGCRWGRPRIKLAVDLDVRLIARWNAVWATTTCSLLFPILEKSVSRSLGLTLRFPLGCDRMDDRPWTLYLSALGTGLIFGYAIQRGGFCLTRALSNCRRESRATDCGISQPLPTAQCAESHSPDI